MKRWVYAYTVVDGDPAWLATVLRSQVRELMRRATATPQAPPAGDGSFVVHLSGDLVGWSAGKDVRVRPAVAEEVDGHTKIGLAWQAEPVPQAFPAFDGALELHPLSARHGQLVLVGAYQVPLGPVGALVDSLLHSVAKRTISGLVERLGEHLERLAAADEPTASVDIPDAWPATLRVWDVMTADPMVFDEHLPLRTAAQLLVHHRVQGAPVVAATGGLIGVLSEQDLLEKEAPLTRLGSRADPGVGGRRQAVTVGEACSRPARITVPEATLRQAAGVMLDHAVARLVVVDCSDITGIITRHDVLTALLRSDAQLQAAAEERLAAVGESDVHVTVTWGEATLAGTAATRSRAQQARDAISDLDGILAVHGHPHWRHDDTPSAIPHAVGL